MGSTANVDLRLEIVMIPVADVDRAKKFYTGLGWREDADFVFTPEFRVVQLTPPNSPCAIMFGKGLTPALPGSTQGLMLVVDDVEAARSDLRARGAQVSEVFHFQTGIHVAGKEGRLPGPDPEHGSYRSFVSFNDPDGNAWLVQEVKTRLPGRLWPSQIDEGAEKLTGLLQEAEQNHGAYEASAPKHPWSVWYAAFILARKQGRTAEQAAKLAASHVEGTRP